MKLYLRSAPTPHPELGYYLSDNAVPFSTTVSQYLDYSGVLRIKASYWPLKADAIAFAESLGHTVVDQSIPENPVTKA